MRFLLCLVCMSVLLVVALPAGKVRAAGEEVKLVKKWKGSVADVALQMETPECITSEKALEKLWKTWKIEEKLPKVDFKKNIVVVVTGRGSLLNLMARLADDGNLEVIGMNTLDFADGFRYVIATVSLEGIKTVNKKELPKE
jgi:hypothetical protein